MQKRGQIKGLWAVVGAVLAAAIIILFTMVILSFAGVFRVPSESEQAAINNFDFLGKKIKEVIEDPAAFASAQLEFQVPDGFVVVGFDKDWHGDLVDDTWLGYSQNTVKNEKTEASNCRDEGIKKPDQCLNQACLCLFKDTNGDDFIEDSSGHVLVAAPPCIVFDGDITISAPADNNLNLDGCEGEIGTTDYDDDCPNDGARKYPVPGYGGFTGWRSDFYEFLVIYGDCDDEFGDPKTYYVEKYEDLDTGKIYIFVAEKLEKIDKRGEALKEISARKLLNHGKQVLDAGETDRALDIFKLLIDKYENSQYITNAKADIKRICDRAAKPEGCTNIDAKYLP